MRGEKGVKSPGRGGKKPVYTPLAMKLSIDEQRKGKKPVT